MSYLPTHVCKVHNLTQGSLSVEECYDESKLVKTKVNVVEDVKEIVN